MVCSSKICACEARSGTMTQMLFTSKPSRSISTLMITRGVAWWSTLNKRWRTGAHSFSPSSAFLPESMVITSSALSPSWSCKKAATSGDTVVSSHTTSILGWRDGSMRAKSASNLRSFLRPALSITRWPSLSAGLPCSSRSALNSSGSAPISLRRSSTSDLTSPARMALFKSKSVMMCGKYTLRLCLPAPTSL